MADELVYNDEDLAILEEDSTEFSPEEFDQDADYAAPPPPIPDGWHQAMLKNLGAKEGEGKPLKPFVGPRSWGPKVPATYFTQIQAVIVDPGGLQDGKQTERFNVTTHPEERRHHTSSASLVYRAMTNEPLPGLKPAGHMAAVLRELQNNPVVWVRTQLVGTSRDAAQLYDNAKKAGQLNGSGLKKPKVYRGNKAFSVDGKLIGAVTDNVTGEVVIGRAEIMDMKHISFEPPAEKK